MMFINLIKITIRLLCQYEVLENTNKRLRYFSLNRYIPFIIIIYFMMIIDWDKNNQILTNNNTNSFS